MVAFGPGGSTPKQRMTQVAAGLGLVDATVIDQHFDQRNRYGRLLMIVAQSPQLLGIGVDERGIERVPRLYNHSARSVRSSRSGSRSVSWPINHDACASTKQDQLVGHE